MNNGIYHVRFSSSNRSVGEGLAVFKDGAVNGGDQGYLYSGRYNLSANVITGDLTVSRWNAGHTSVFGPLSTFTLSLKGGMSPDGSSFSVNGSSPDVPGATITINGRRLQDAA